MKRWLRRNGKWVKPTIVGLVLAVIYITASTAMKQTMREAGLAGLKTALQIVLMLFMAIIQFVAIFWFMSQTKITIVRPGDPKTLTFDDYKGQPNLLTLVRQWLILLSDRTQFQRMGGQLINGLLLVGEPGTGKTLLAKCMAGEGQVAFISIEGSGFRGMFWGVDVLRMIQFIGKATKLAKEWGACICFIDEIDAVGTSRGNVMGEGGARAGMGGGMFGGGSGALTRLLYSMDGVEDKGRWDKLFHRLLVWMGFDVPLKDWHVLFMGSTNRPDVLDSALTRPGRFDRTITVGRADRQGRREIVEYYLGKIVHDDTVNIEAIVSDTSGATPAAIMSAITKDAVRLAIFSKRDAVSQYDIDRAFQEQVMGLENPIEEMEEDQRRSIACHEAGHAVAKHYLAPWDRIVRVSIIRRTEALGYVLPAPRYDIYAMPLNHLVAGIVVSLAGHEATRLLTGQAWTGASADFTTVRARLWALYQHGAWGPPLQGLDATEFFKSEQAIKVWQDLERQTRQFLNAHEAEVKAVAQALLERGDLSGEDVLTVMQEATR